MTNFENLFNQALNNVAELAKEYASSVVCPFCDKYGLRIYSFDKTWCFYFFDPKRDAKYPGRLVPVIEEYLKTGEFLDCYLFHHGVYKEVIDPHLEFLKTLPDEFWKQLKEIKAVENRFITVLNNYYGIVY